LPKNQIHGPFWYLKDSGGGLDNKISGEVINLRLYDSHAYGSVQLVNQSNNVKEVKIDGCHYKLRWLRKQLWMNKMAHS
jgi:hypothetical protein